MVIPAYQAEATIQPVVEGVLKEGFAVIVVDDASRDATALRARQAGAKVIPRFLNGGKGTALREGIQAALRAGFRWIVTMDADGQHLPEEIPRLLEAAKEGRADFILGNRMGDPRGMPIERRITNRLMSWLLSLISRQRIPDTQCGFRLLSHRLLEKVPLTTERFEIDSELVVKSAWDGFRIVSIPIRSVYCREFSFIRPLKDTTRFFRFLWFLRRQGSR